MTKLINSSQSNIIVEKGSWLLATLQNKHPTKSLLLKFKLHETAFKILNEYDLHNSKIIINMLLIIESISNCNENCRTTLLCNGMIMHLQSLVNQIFEINQIIDLNHHLQIILHCSIIFSNFGKPLFCEYTKQGSMNLIELNIIIFQKTINYSKALINNQQEIIINKILINCLKCFERIIKNHSYKINYIVEILKTKNQFLDLINQMIDLTKYNVCETIKTNGMKVFNAFCSTKILNKQIIYLIFYGLYVKDEIIHLHSIICINNILKCNDNEFIKKFIEFEKGKIFKILCDIIKQQRDIVQILHTFNSIATLLKKEINSKYITFKLKEFKFKQILQELHLINLDKITSLQQNDSQEIIFLIDLFVNKECF